MLLTYCYIAAGAGFWTGFTQSGGVELFSLLHPEADRRAIELATFLMAVLWPIPAVMLLMRNE